MRAGSATDAPTPVTRREIVGLTAISKRFGSTQAVSGLTLSIRAGEVHALLGENGAGKSTVGKILCGLAQPDTGEVRLDGRSVRLRTVAEAHSLGIGMVFQELSVVRDLTVRENIHLGAEAGAHPFARLSRRMEERESRALVDAHGFDVDLDARLGDLSVADQQLIEVLKALARKPRVLVLDEPTAMLGVREKNKLLGIIGQARGAGVAVVFITHHVDEVMAVADRVSLMKDGALLESFAMTDAVTASAIVEKLAGRPSTASDRRRRHVRQREVFLIRNLPGPRPLPVDISVRSGEVVGLYGVVGSGCERIGRAAVGLADVGPAVMSLDGAIYRPRSPAEAARAGVSYLASGRAASCILPGRSIRENLMISQLHRTQRLGVVRRSSERRLTQSLLARFRVRYADPEDDIATLSGGNQQKVMIARCLGRTAKLIVLEDPTAGVDIASKRDIHDLIRGEAAAGTSILLVSSDLRETIALSDVIHTAVRGRMTRRYLAPTPADEARIVADVIGA